MIPDINCSHISEMDFFYEKKSISCLSSSSGGLYIHVPYCRKKCIYCDFYSVGEKIASWSAFVDALIAELSARIIEMPRHLATVYIGGGTPSLMPSDEFLRLCGALRQFTHDVREFTIEVNPDDVDVEKLETWKRGGVSRLSMGIQSLDDSLLAKLGRRHTAKAARSAFLLARQYFHNISVDLIFGLPGQTLDMWKADLDRVIDWRPEHISAYSLMYEVGTALTLLRDRGDIQESSEDLTEDMFNMLVSTLRNAGYDHYEISNFALPGFRSIHNSSYWRQIPYLGLGPAAHSYDGKSLRSANKADVRAYIRHWTDSPGSAMPDGMTIREHLSLDELKEEFIMTSLRTREGISAGSFSNTFGIDAWHALLNKSKQWIADGVLLYGNGHLALSERALLISDTIIVDLL